MPLKGVYEDNYWTAQVAEGLSQQSSLPAAIGHVIESFSPYQQFLINFSDSGGTAELFIGWFFDEGNTGEVIDWRLLERLSQMRIGLSLDIYDRRFGSV